MKYLKIGFLVMTTLLIMGSGTGEIKFTEGLNPGFLAPEIDLQGVTLDKNGYTLIQFWAAYNAESRAKNVKLCNDVSRLNSKQLKMISIAFDEKQSIFNETIKADRLDLQTQFNDFLGKESDIYKKYHLSKGFYNILVNPQGVIVARDVQPGQIVGILTYTLSGQQN